MKDRFEKIKDIEYKIRQIKKDLAELEEKYHKAFAPKGYGHGTSYNDYDTIPGGNKELHLESYSDEIIRLTTLLELNEEILLSLKREVDTNEYLNLLTNNYQKVKFLRIVKGETQAKTAEMLNIGMRTVQRIESSFNRI